jgi:outer membrane protein assembly factor BamB
MRALVSFVSIALLFFFAACAVPSPPSAIVSRERQGVAPSGSAQATPEPASLAPALVPTKAALLALLSVHQLPSPAPAMPGGVLGAPIDYKTLPQSAVLWRRSDLEDSFPHAVGSVFIVDRWESITGIDAHTGRTLWSIPVEHPGDVQMGHSVMACDDSAVIFAPNAIIGVRAQDGKQRWRIAETHRASSIYLTPGFPVVYGCRVAFHRVAGTRTLSEEGEPSDAFEVDANSGVERALGPGRVVELGPDYAVMEDAGGRCALVRAGRKRTALPAHTHYVVSPGGADELAVVLPPDDSADNGVVKGVNVRSGALAWSRPAERLGADATTRTTVVTPIGDLRSRPLLTRRGDDVIVVGTGTVERVDLRTGRSRWSVPISDELSNAHDVTETALAGDDFVMTNRRDPSLVITLDARTGALRAMRLAPQDPVYATTAGRTLVITAHDETVGIDLDHEAPPLRSLLSLDGDVTLSLRELDTPYGPPPAATVSGFIPVHLFPAGRTASTQWLHRLLPLVGDRLLLRVRIAPPEEAIPLLDVFRNDTAPQTAQALGDLLRRTMAPPSLDLARLRYAVANAISFTLPPETASRLADSMIEWAAALRPEWLRPHALEDCDDPPSRKKACATLEAIAESRNLLERASAQAAPLARFRSALATSPVGSTCVASEDDRARAAVLSHLLELQTVASLAAAPGAGCVEAVTLTGRVTADTSGRPSKRQLLLIQAPHSPTASAAPPGETGLAAASARLVPYMWSEDGHGSSGGEFLVKKVDGLWRVVDEAGSWIE